MADNDGSAPTSRRRHIVRLAVFAAFLVALFYLLAVRHVVDIEDVRRTVKATGPAAPLTYIVLSAVLGAIFVPGPILAASSTIRNSHGRGNTVASIARSARSCHGRR